MRIRDGMQIASYYIARSKNRKSGTTNNFKLKFSNSWYVIVIGFLKTSFSITSCHNSNVM